MSEINLDGIDIGQLIKKEISPEINLDGIDLSNLVNKEKATGMETFSYAFEKEGNLSRDFGDYMETIIPLGRVVMPWEDAFDETGFYQSPVETYGEEWATASQDERRKMILNTRAQQLEEEYGDKEFDKESGAYLAGTIAKAVADPSTAIPFGQGVRAAIGVGGAVSAASSTAKDLAEEGEVNLADVAVDTLTGAAVSGVFQYGGQKVANVFRKKAMNTKVKKAQKVLDESPYKDVSKALKDAGYNDKQIAEVGSAAQATGKKLVVRKANKTNPEAEANEFVTRHAHTQKDSKLDKAFGIMSTRLMNIHPALGRRLRQYEQGSRETFNSYAQGIEPFVKSYRALDGETRKSVNFLLANGKFDEVTKLVGKDSPLGQALPQLKQTLNTAGKDLKASGRVFDENPDYFPRLVRDYEQMSSELYDETVNSLIGRRIKAYADKKGVTVGEVTSHQKDSIANSVLRAYDPLVASGVPSNLKRRLIKEVDKDVHAKYYMEADEALTRYISGASHDIHVNKMFGKFGGENLDTSIGALVNDFKLNTAQQSDVSDILKARFQGGRQSAGKYNQLLKNVGYMGTIGQFTSTITQLGDPFVSAAKHGTLNTIRSFFGAVGNKSKMKLIDIAIDDEVMAEIASDPTLTSRLLNKVLTATGFKAVDRIGKETIINSNFKMLQAQAKRSPKVIRDKWKVYYGDDMDNLIDDLARGKITPLTKEHAFATLSDFQPISMSEMPELYAKHPDARILYMLKSFTLKMWDLARKDIYNEWRNGNKKQAAQAMATMGLYLAAGNTATSKIKDLMLGRDIEPENLPNDLMWNLLGVYGFGKYQFEQSGRDGLVDTTFGMAQPPIPLVDAAEGAYKYVTAEENFNDPNKDARKVVRNLPVVGNIATNWFMGGAEAYNQRLEKEKYKD